MREQLLVDNIRKNLNMFSMSSGLLFIQVRINLLLTLDCVHFHFHGQIFKEDNHS